MVFLKIPIKLLGCYVDKLCRWENGAMAKRAIKKKIGLVPNGPTNKGRKANSALYGTSTSKIGSQYKLGTLGTSSRKK